MTLKILYLVSKNYHDSKMSRVRFHSMEAVFKKCEGFSYWGPGYSSSRSTWDENLTCQENIDKEFPGVEWDLVVGFKPLGMKDFKDIKYRKCLRYNEMFDKNFTINEIVQSGADLIICHHYNDYIEYKELFSKVKGPKPITFKFVPHSAEQTIFKPIPEIKKTIDVAIVGATNVQTMLGEHYPLRARMVELIKKLPKQYNVKVFPHVGGNHSDAHTDKYAKEFAETINSAKIVITDCGAPKSRFGKYIEIPMCGTAIAGDVYDDEPKDVERLKEFLIEINMEMDDYEILESLVYYIENTAERKFLIHKGLEYTKDFTHEKYAQRFIEAINE